MVSANPYACGLDTPIRPSMQSRQLRGGTATFPRVMQLLLWILLGLPKRQS